MGDSMYYFICSIKSKDDLLCLCNVMAIMLALENDERVFVVLSWLVV